MAPSMLTRRALLGVVVAGVLLGACDADRSDEAAGANASEPMATDRPLTTDDPAANQPTRGSQQCSGADASPVSPAPEATVTFGPINGVEETTTADGEPLIILGTVYSEDCEPLADATLTMYQTDGNGEYGRDTGPTTCAAATSAAVS
jgi:protocatechuate 3,4-dioxygenase beta subunit